jgi:hypothetical protein
METHSVNNLLLMMMFLTECGHLFPKRFVFSGKKEIIESNRFAFFFFVLLKSAQVFLNTSNKPVLYSLTQTCRQSNSHLNFVSFSIVVFFLLELVGNLAMGTRSRLPVYRWTLFVSLTFLLITNVHQPIVVSISYTLYLP